MEYLARASGFGLGYIHDNLRGGVYGQHLAKLAYRKRYSKRGINRTLVKKGFLKYSPTMAPIGKKRFRKDYSRNPFISKKGKPTSSRSLGNINKKIQQTLRNLRARQSAKRGAVSLNNAAPGSVRHVASKVKSTKGLYKRRDKVHVTKEFKDKVAAALVSKEIGGWFQETVCNRMSVPPDNMQAIDYAVPNYNTGLAFFDTSSVLNAASVLWNGKTNVVPGASRTLTEAGNFNKNTIKINVRNSYAKLRLRNNSSRIKYLKVYEFQSKGNAELDPYAWWVGNTQANAINEVARFGYLVSELFASPGMCPEFKNQWTTAVKEYVMEPGQETTHFVQGPSNKVYDYEKFQVPGSPVSVAGDPPITKHVRFVMIVHYNDIVGTVGGSFGRYTDSAGTSDPFGLICECTTYYNLGMPEQTGFKYPASTIAGVVQPNTLRRHTYYMRTWFGVQQGAVARVDEVAPNITESGV